MTVTKVSSNWFRLFAFTNSYRCLCVTATLREATVSSITSAGPHGTTRLSLDRLPWNFIFTDFSKIYLESWSFIKIWHELTGTLPISIYANTFCFVFLALYTCWSTSRGTRTPILKLTAVLYTPTRWHYEVPLNDTSNQTVSSLHMIQHPCFNKSKQPS
jgi:hypothetical protein